ncbi:MAG: GNAT family N-acetyltransferase [Thermoplasmata archaeon]
MLVREVRWSDFDDLREMYYELYEERERGEPIGITLFTDRPSLADEVAWFAEAYRGVLEGHTVFSVAEEGGRIVGNCQVHRKGPSARFEGGHVGVLGILVHRDHRGKGVGRVLLAHALDACRGRFETVRLSVFMTNARAKHLYEKFGFVTVGRVPRAVRRGSRYFDEDEMVLVLPPVPENP